jgi:hypothetical protein
VAAAVVGAAPTELSEVRVVAIFEFFVVGVQLLRLLFFLDGSYDHSRRVLWLGDLDEGVLVG